jgi:molybdenum cofactor cytidylyltransferase
MDEIKKKIGLIILAAGESKRLNYFPKQLLKVNEKTLLRNAAENALSSDAALVCVVLGANFEKLKSEIEDLSLEIVANENWADGMASSLQKGLRKLLEIESDLQGFCVTLCDQPLISYQIINRLINVFQTDNPPIVASEYAETIGVPAIFGKPFFDELLNLKSSESAKKVMTKHLDSVKKISVPEAEFDIDTKEDFESFLKKQNNW